MTSGRCTSLIRMVPTTSLSRMPTNTRRHNPSMKELQFMTLDSSMLGDNITRSIFATAQDELRPVMNGIYFDLTTDALAIVASDGHKLVRNKIFTIKSDQPSAFILPKKPATLLKNLLGKDDSDVVIRFDERNAEISFADRFTILPTH